MSNEVMQVLLGLFTLLGSIATGYFAWKVRSVAVSVKKDVTEVKTDVKEVVKKVGDYHREVNGMKTELVEEVRGRAQLEGEKKGAEDNQAKTDAKEQDKK